MLLMKNTRLQKSVMDFRISTQNPDALNDSIIFFVGKCGKCFKFQHVRNNLTFVYLLFDYKKNDDITS